MEMHRSLEVASALGARKVVLHPSMASGLGGFVLETVKAYVFDFLSGKIKGSLILRSLKAVVIISRGSVTLGPTQRITGGFFFALPVEGIPKPFEPSGAGIVTVGVSFFFSAACT